MDRLVIRPIDASRAQQRPGPFVVESPIYLDVSSKRGIERLPLRGDPVQDG
jgi:hypothetical protein